MPSSPICRPFAGRMSMTEPPSSSDMPSRGGCRFLATALIFDPCRNGSRRARQVAGIAERWDAGHRHTTEVLARAPWTETVGPLEGLILHEADSGHMVGPAR
jgi:NTE family protein